MKCPQCTKELEKINPVTYSCHSCKENFAIYTEREMKILSDIGFNNLTPEQTNKLLHEYLEKRSKLIDE